MGRLVIRKLFRMHDFDIDLSKKCIVLIGENGLGKSTILKIIHCLVNGDFLGLLKFQFESITIVDNSQELIIRYSELFPSPELFRNSYSLRRTAFQRSGISDAKDVNDEGARLFDTGIQSAIIIRVFDKLGEVAYRSLLSSCYLETEYDEEVASFLSNLPDSLNSSSDQDAYVDHVRKELLASLEYGGYFLTSPLFEQRETIHSGSISSLLGIHDSMFMDMVEKWTFITTHLQPPTQPDNKELEKFCFGQKIMDYFNEDPDDLPYNDNIPESNEGYIGNVMENSASRLRYIFQSNMILKTNGIEINPDPIKQNRFSVNEILSMEFYEQEYLEHINYVMMIYFIDLIGKPRILPTAEEENEIYTFYMNHFNEIIETVQPLIVKNSIFDKPFRELADISHGPYDQTDSAFIRFYNSEIEGIKAYRSKDVASYEDILKKFLFNKKAKVTNTGLIIANPNGVSVNLNQLSSGEKKIVMLAFVSIFKDDLSIFLDEPELSLSIVWQTWLLDVLLVSKKEDRKVLIATHSPYIVEDERWLNYLHPLYLDLERG